MSEPTPKRRRMETALQPASKDWEANLAMDAEVEDALQMAAAALAVVVGLQEEAERVKAQQEEKAHRVKVQLQEAAARVKVQLQEAASVKARHAVQAQEAKGQLEEAKAEVAEVKAFYALQVQEAKKHLEMAEAKAAYFKAEAANMETNAEEIYAGNILKSTFSSAAVSKAEEKVSWLNKRAADIDETLHTREGGHREGNVSLRAAVQLAMILHSQANAPNEEFPTEVETVVADVKRLYNEIKALRYSKDSFEVAESVETQLSNEETHSQRPSETATPLNAGHTPPPTTSQFTPTPTPLNAGHTPPPTTSQSTPTPTPLNAGHTPPSTPHNRPRGTKTRVKTERPRSESRSTVKAQRGRRNRKHIIYFGRTNAPSQTPQPSQPSQPAAARGAERASLPLSIDVSEASFSDPDLLRPSLPLSIDVSEASLSDPGAERASLPLSIDVSEASLSDPDSLSSSDLPASFP